MVSLGGFFYHNRKSHRNLQSSKWSIQIPRIMPKKLSSRTNHEEPKNKILSKSVHGARSYNLFKTSVECGGPLLPFFGWPRPFVISPVVVMAVR